MENFLIALLICVVIVICWVIIYDNMQLYLVLKEIGMNRDKFNIDVLVEKYRNSNMRDDEKLKSLDEIDFCAFIWNLRNGRFELIAFQNRGFLCFFMNGCVYAKFIINELEYNKKDFLNKLENLK